MEGGNKLKSPFTLLNKEDVEKLRREPVVSNNGTMYKFSQSDINNAKKHLESIYSGTVYYSFSSKILLLNEIY